MKFLRKIWNRLFGESPSPNPTPTPIPSGNWKAELLSLMNAVRPPAAPLHPDSKLDLAAGFHADQMASTGIMAHTLGMSTPASRVTNSGYDWSAVGEDIGWGQQTARDIFDAWMGSPGHRRIILSGDYTDVGFGMKDHYWCAVFARSFSHAGIAMPGEVQVSGPLLRHG